MVSNHSYIYLSKMPNTTPLSKVSVAEDLLLLPHSQSSTFVQTRLSHLLMFHVNIMRIMV